jgi:hypothetical protein
MQVVELESILAIEAKNKKIRENAMYEQEQRARKGRDLWEAKQIQREYELTDEEMEEVWY